MIGGNIIFNTRPKKAVVRARIIRADGSVEDIGTIAYYHRNPIWRALWRIGQWFKRV